MLLGADIDQMTDQELAEAVESVTVFAKLSPDQKSSNYSTIEEKWSCRWLYG